MDAASHRLFVPRSTHTQVIDEDSGKVLGDIPGQKRGDPAGGDGYGNPTSKPSNQPDTKPGHPRSVELNPQTLA